MKYSNIDINNNILFQYQKENNNSNMLFIPQNEIKQNHPNKNLLSNNNNFINLLNNFNINKRHPIALNNFMDKNIYHNNNDNNILKNNYLDNIFFNSFSSRSIRNNKYNNNNINNIMCYDFGNRNVKNKGLYKTPQSRSCVSINFNLYNNNKKQNIYNNIIKDNINVNDYGFYDIRVDYCLHMLNLDELKNIFHNKNIGFNEMLYLSQKDMKKMGIPIYYQLIIQKFTKDYLQKADLYTTEELQRFFQLYYKNNIKKINNNRNFYKTPIRCFSPMANYNKKLLNNNFNYNINNNFSEVDDKMTNNDINIYNNINNNNNKKKKVNNNHRVNQRNCLSASPRKIRTMNLKKNNNKILNKKRQIQYVKNYYYNQRQKNKNPEFLTDNYNCNYNNIDNFINSHSNYLNYNITNSKFSNNIYNAYINSIKKNNNNINGISSKENKKEIYNQKINDIEKYKNKEKIVNKKSEGNINLLNIPFNNYFKENSKNYPQKKMNDVLMQNQNNYRKKELTYKNNNNNVINSYENINNFKYDNNNLYYISDQEINSLSINSNYLYPYENASKQSKIKPLINKNKINMNEKYINPRSRTKNNHNKITYSQTKNLNHNNKKINNDFIQNKSPNNKKRNDNFNYNTNKSASIVSIDTNSQNVINNNNMKKQDMSNNKQNINNQNLIINERNNLNIYYNSNDLINKNIFNYDTISSSSGNYIKNKAVKNRKNNFLQNKNKMKEIIKKVNKNIISNINSKKIRQMPQKLIQHNISPNNYYMNNPKRLLSYNQNDEIINKNITIKSKNNNFSNNVCNKKNNKLKNKRCNSQSQLNDINYINLLNNKKRIGRNNDVISDIRYYSPQYNFFNCNDNSYINRINYNNIKNTDGTDDYYINYL